MTSEKTILKRTPEDILNLVSYHLQYLEKHCAQFDQGDKAGMLLASVSLRTLLHQTKNNVSALKHMNATNWMFLTTNLPLFKNNLLDQCGLTYMRFANNSGKNVASLNEFPERHRWVSFNEWWTETVTSSSGQKALHTRRDVVLHVADKMIAHIDKSADANLDDLFKNSHGWNFTITTDSGEISTKVDGLIEAMLRQISFETLCTFRKQLPSMFA